MNTFLHRLRFSFAALLISAYALLLTGCPGDELDLPPPPQTVSITQQPADQSVTSDSTATFVVVANGGGVTYQWQSLVGGTWTNIVGATNSTYSIVNAAQGQSGTQYRVIVISGANVVVSSPATLTVTIVVIAPAITVPPANQTVTEPATATFNVTATGTAPLTYQWQRNVGGTFINISGATAATNVTPATVRANDNGAQFRVIVTNSANNATSAAATLTVNQAPVAPAFTTQPADITVIAPSTATFTVAATGTPAPILQWQVSIDGGTTFGNVTAGTGGTSGSYTTEATNVSMSGRRYRAVATNSVSSVNSNAAILTVNPMPVAPAITQEPVDQSVVVPDTAIFSVVATGTPSPTYQWQRSNDSGVNWNNVVGATNASYTTPATVVGDNDARFRVVVANIAGTVTSNVAILTVGAAFAPVITTQPSNVSVNAGNLVAFTAAASGAPTPTYQWQRSDDGGVTWANVGGAATTAYSFTPARADDGAEFRMVATNSAGSATSDAARFESLGSFVVLTSVGGSAPGSASTPAFTRFDGAGIDNAGNFIFTFGGPGLFSAIRRIVPATGVLTDILDIPGGFAFGTAFTPTNDMYVASFNQIRVLPNVGAFSVFAGGYNRVASSVVFNAGSLFLTEENACGVQAITVPGGVKSMLAGSGSCAVAADGTGAAAGFRQPTGMVLENNGDLLVCDSFAGDERLVRVTSAGVATTLSSSGVGIVGGTPTRVRGCFWLTRDSDGNVYFLAGADVIKRKPNGVTAVVGRLASNIETRILQWAAPGFIAIGNGGNLVRLDVR